MVFLCVVLCCVVVSGVGSTVSALCFDYSATYLAMGTTDGNVRVAVVKDWSEPLVSRQLVTMIKKRIKKRRMNACDTRRWKQSSMSSHQHYCCLDILFVMCIPSPPSSPSFVLILHVSVRKRVVVLLPQVLNGLHTKGVSALCWGGQAAVGVGGRESYLVSCSLDRTLKVIGVAPTAA